MHEGITPQLLALRVIYCGNEPLLFVLACIWSTVFKPLYLLSAFTCICQKRQETIVSNYTLPKQTRLHALCYLSCRWQCNPKTLTNSACQLFSASSLHMIVVSCEQGHPQHAVALTAKSGARKGGAAALIVKPALLLLFTFKDGRLFPSRSL